MEKNEKQESEIRIKAAKITGTCAVIAAIVAGLFACRGDIADWWKAHYAEPLIQVHTEDDGSTLVFEADEEYRSVHLYLIPQLLIRYRDTVVLIIHIDGYFEPDYLELVEQRASTEIRYEDSVETLIYCLKTGIKEYAISEGALSEEEFEEDFSITVSWVAGIEYINLKGNTVKQYCMAESLSGSVVNLDLDDAEVGNRLYQAEYKLTNDLSAIPSDETLETFIEQVAEEIIREKAGA